MKKISITVKPLEHIQTPTNNDVVMPKDPFPKQQLPTNNDVPTPKPVPTIINNNSKKEELEK